jgi:3-oxoacyl-[acyl-carrier-protein] synthase-3
MRTNESTGIGVWGTGQYIPPGVMTNAQVEDSAGLPSGYVESKTGIVTRHIAGKDETASQMSAHAANQALEAAGITASDLGLILGCSFTGDYRYPAMACKVHSLIGANKAAAFDVMANCTGFQVGMTVASDRMRVDPSVKYSLVLGTALQSRFINWKDPNSAIFFGDGAGAAVLGPVPKGYGVLGSEIFTHSKAYESVRLRGGGSSFPAPTESADEQTRFYEINGMEVWKQVVQYQPLVIQKLLEKIGKKTEDVDFFIFHQANLRLIEFLMAKLKLPMSKTFINVTRYGNTADASIAIALDDAVRAGQIGKGSLVILSGVGAGFTFGATALKWYSKND